MSPAGLEKPSDSPGNKHDGGGVCAHVCARGDEDPEHLRSVLADILEFARKHPELAREHLRMEVETSPFEDVE